MKPIPTQIEIVGAFAKALERLGVKTATASEMNAIIQAATLVRNELRRENVGSTPAMGLAAWCRSDDTGLSSVYMAWVLNGGTLPVEPTTPLRATRIAHRMRIARRSRKVRLDMRDASTRLGLREPR